MTRYCAAGTQSWLTYLVILENRGDGRRLCKSMKGLGGEVVARGWRKSREEVLLKQREQRFEQSGQLSQKVLFGREDGVGRCIEKLQLRVKEEGDTLADEALL